MQENNYCDEQVMLYWVEKCLKPYLESTRPHPYYKSILMMDNSKAHLVKSVRKAVGGVGAHQVMLPSNITSRVQLLDVGVNEPFKVKLNEQYSDFLIEIRFQSSNPNTVHSI